MTLRNGRSRAATPPTQFTDLAKAGATVLAVAARLGLTIAARAADI
jgi:hypothetical protein